MRLSAQILSISVVLVGMLVNSVIIGSCASLLANLDTSAVEKQQKFDAINEQLGRRKCPPPCLTTPPHLPAWWLPGLPSPLRNPQRSLNIVEACSGPECSPPAAPKVADLPFSRHLTYHKVSKPLADSVRLYYEYLYSCGHQRDESSLLKVHQLVSMPSVPCLRTPPRVPVWWP